MCKQNMDDKILLRAIRLAGKTGDRLIIVDPSSGTAHAVLPLDAYEKLANGIASLHVLSDNNLENSLPEETCLDSDFDADILEDFEDKPFKAVPASEKGNKLSENNEKNIDATIEKALSELKMAEQSKKEEIPTVPMDILDNEADEEQYYLEPIE
jgi:hypothetical protein